MRTAVVIPAYRVAAHIAAVIAAVPEAIDRIFVVDDASPDDLVSVISGLGDPRIRLLRHESNRGVGGATLTGIEAALDEQFDVVVKLDGDGQMDPRQIPLLLAPIAEGHADHVKASRFHHVRELRSMPRWRFIGNVGLTFLTKLASGYWNILDPVNGFFATRTAILRRLPLETISRRYFFETDLLIRLNIVEARVADIALPARYGSEPSSLSVVRALFDFPPRLVAGLIRRVFWRYIFYDVSPVAVFGWVGALLASFGAIFGGYEWAYHAAHHQATPLGTVMIAVLPLIFGFQLLLQAVVLDIGNTPRPSRRQTGFRSGRPDSLFAAAEPMENADGESRERPVER